MPAWPLASRSAVNTCCLLRFGKRFIKFRSFSEPSSMSPAPALWRKPSSAAAGGATPSSAGDPSAAKSIVGILGRPGVPPLSALPRSAVLFKIPHVGDGAAPSLWLPKSPLIIGLPAEPSHDLSSSSAAWVLEAVVLLASSLSSLLLLPLLELLSPLRRKGESWSEALGARLIRRITDSFAASETLVRSLADSNNLHRCNQGASASSNGYKLPAHNAATAAGKRRRSSGPSASCTPVHSASPRIRATASCRCLSSAGHFLNRSPNAMHQIE
mmetsp:Transcript_18817/g.53917  ORF Transcript_18817/g.53917 Transcript_18817/m.53917 type:complete len:271 (-) Transcript_18817:1342-2154(-)